MNEAIVALDLGTTNIKALLISPGGEILDQSSSTHPSHSPRSNWVEQDHTSWWEVSSQVLHELVQDFDGDIRAVGLTGQMHGCVCLDENGDVIRPPIIWQDARSEQELEVLPETTFEISGSPPATGMMAPTLLWLRHHEPEHFDRIHRVVLPKDYLRYRLTGEVFTDHSDAAGSLLYDIRERRWSRELCSSVGLNPDTLPAIRYSYEVCGRLDETASRQTGLPEGIPVVAGAGDTVAATLGSGVIRNGQAGYTLGTAAQLKVVTPDPIVDSSQRIQIFPHATGDRWILMGAILSGGASLDWARKVLNVQESHERMLETVREQSQPGAQGVLFLPYLFGERAPHMDPRARGAFLGLRSEHERADLIRAVLEGVGYALRDCQSVMEELGYSFDRITATGGGGKNPFWSDIMANILNAEVVGTSIDEETAYGAGMLAGVGAGWFDSVDDVAEEWVTNQSASTPDQPDVEIHDRLHAVYESLYDQLKTANRTLSSLRKQGEL